MHQKNAGVSVSLKDSFSAVFFHPSVVLSLGAASASYGQIQMQGLVKVGPRVQVLACRGQMEKFWFWFWNFGGPAITEKWGSSCGTAVEHTPREQKLLRS